MTPVPEITNLDIAFGNIKHMPKYDDVPEDFKTRGNVYCDFVSKWFFRGIDETQINRLKPKGGVDKNKALAAIRSILASFEPKHEHKEAGSAYLLSQWFDLGLKMQQSFRTHTGEIVQGEQLQAALNAVADDWEALSHAIRAEDAYASHVTESTKIEMLNKGIARAAEIRGGKVDNFTIWQRVNQKLTGECVALLPKS